MEDERNTKRGVEQRMSVIRQTNTHRAVIRTGDTGSYVSRSAVVLHFRITPYRWTSCIYLSVFISDCSHSLTVNTERVICSGDKTQPVRGEEWDNCVVHRPAVLQFSIQMSKWTTMWKRSLWHPNTKPYCPNRDCSSNLDHSNCLFPLVKSGFVCYIYKWTATTNFGLRFILQYVYP